MDPPVDENLFLAISQELTNLEKNPANECVMLAGIPELQNTETASPPVATGGEVDKQRSGKSASYERMTVEAANVDQNLGLSLNENDKMISMEMELISKSGSGALLSDTAFRQSSSNDGKSCNTGSQSLSDCNQPNESKAMASKLSEQSGLGNDDEDSTNLETIIKPMVCRICEKEFMEPIVLDGHYKAVHDLDNAYQCWRCVYCTSAYSCMERHMEFCGSMTPFPCDRCLEMFENMDALSEHCAKVHSGSVSRFHCTDCVMEFESDTALAKHSEAFHPKNKSLEAELFCSECGDVFENTRELLEHKVCAHSQDLTAQGTKITLLNEKRKHGRNKVVMEATGEPGITAVKQETDCDVALVDTNRPSLRKLPKVRLIAAKSKIVGKEKFWVASEVGEDQKFALDANLDTGPNIAPEKDLDNELDSKLLADAEKPRKVGKRAPKGKQGKLGPTGSAVKSKPKKAKVDTDVFDTLYLCPHVDAGCKYKSTKKSNLSYHLRTHKNRYSCESCDFQCCKKKQLKLHYKSVHGRDVNPGFLCSMCGKSFRNGTKLKIHIRVHNNDRPFICDQCGQGFASKYMMSEHQKVKHGGEIFPCGICGKKFPVKKYLSKHVKTHDSTKPFFCDMCPKAFKTANHLKAHTRVHTGEKPFECKECGKCFKQICGLMAHKNIHKGEKTFNCTTCQRAFMYNTSLRAGVCLHCRKSAHEDRAKISKTLEKGDFTDFVKSRNSGYFPNVYVPVSGIPGITTSTVADSFVDFAKAGPGVLPPMPVPVFSGASSESP